MRYLHDLNVQISQKRRSVSVSRQMERDLCNQHFDTFETFWGRPGHGAPSGDKINKLKLDNLLYGDPETSEKRKIEEEEDASFNKKQKVDDGSETFSINITEEGQRMEPTFDELLVEEPIAEEWNIKKIFDADGTLHF
ncbi:GH19603 [Drosophila grimshawi]|uniref:GH19603 n=1 Tax=Drosophila grimshawi TaxID=7222 RepID=B4JI25_DROGR|nr:GH19603 [Drosophila grimshawi]